MRKCHFHSLHIWCVLVTQSCPTICDPMDCSPPGSSVHEISQARILEWVVIFFSRGSSPPRDRVWVSCIAGRLFTNWAAREYIPGALHKMKNISSRSVFSFSPFRGSFWLKVQTFGKEIKWSSSLLGLNWASRPQQALGRKLFTQAHQSITRAGNGWKLPNSLLLSVEEEEIRCLRRKSNQELASQVTIHPFPKAGPALPRPAFSWPPGRAGLGPGRPWWEVAGLCISQPGRWISRSQWHLGRVFLPPPSSSGPPFLALPSLLKRKIASGENKPQVSLHVDNINGKLREESLGDLGSCHHLSEQGRSMLRTRMWTYQWVILLRQGKLDGGETCVREAEPGLGHSPSIWHLRKRSYLLFL